LKPRRAVSLLCYSIVLIALFSCYASAQSAPSISSISPTAGPVSPVGSSVTINGANFGATQGSSTVTFGGVATTPSSWSNTKIVAPVPSSLAPGFVDVVVTVNGASSNAQSFLVIPIITGCTPCSGIIGTSVKLTGTSFGDSQGSSTVTFNGTSASPSTWSNTSITVAAPVGASNGPIVVTINGWGTNGVTFSVMPNILNLQPPNGPVGTQVTITGNGFGQSQNVVSGVSFNGVAATIGTWSDTSITAAVPQNATTGNVVVTTASNLVSNGVSFTVGQPQDFAISISPNPGTVSEDLETAYTLSVSPSGGFSGDVLLSVSGAPSGATASFNPSSIISGGSGSSGLFVSTSSSTATGTYKLTITATSGSLTHTANVNLIVNPPAPDFSFSASPSSQTVPLGGGNASYTASVSPLNGFISNVSLSVSGLPTGATASFNPVSISGGSGSSTLNISTTSSTPPGTYLVRIAGTGGPQHSALVDLIIDQPPDFSLWVDPSETIAAGDTVTYATTVTALGGFNDTVSLSVGGLPAGVTASFNPTAITGGSGSSTLTLSTTTSVPTGSYLFLVGGTSGNFSHSYNANLGIGALQSITITPPTINMLAGDARTVSLMDNLKRPVKGAVWSVSNPAVISLSTDDPPVITALQPTTTGSPVTLMAQYKGLQATAQLTVSAGHGMLIGTTPWSVPPTTGNSIAQILIAVPTINPPPLIGPPAPNTPDLFAIEQGSSKPIRGFTADGKQLWAGTVAGPNDTLSTTVPDTLGGTVSLIWDATASKYALIKLDGTTGKQSWRQDALETINPGFAIGNDGTIFISALEDGGKTTRVIGLDPSTGFVKFKSDLTSSTDNYSSSQYGAVAGRITVAPDGFAYVLFSYYNKIWSWDGQGGDSATTDHYLSLLKVDSSGNASTQQLKHYSGTATTIQANAGWITISHVDHSPVPTAAEVIPDGKGDVLAAWTYKTPGGCDSSYDHISEIGLTFNCVQAVSEAHIANQGGGDFSLSPTITDWAGEPNQTQADPGATLILGDNQTAFAGNGSPLVSFNVNGGGVNWSKVAQTNETFELLAAAAGGGLVAKDNGQITILDSSGTPSTTDTVNPTLLSSPPLLQYSPRTGDWFGILSNGNLAVIPEPEINTAPNSFAFAGGNASRTRAAVPIISEVASCSGVDKDAPTIVVPFNGSNSFNLRVESGTVLLQPADSTLITVSPASVSAAAGQVTVNVFGQSQAGQTTIDFYQNGRKLSGLSMTVYLKKMVNKKATDFGIFDSIEGLTPNYIPKSQSLQSELNRIYQNQTFIQFTVTPPTGADYYSINDIHWDTSPQDRKLHEPAYFLYPYDSSPPSPDDLELHPLYMHIRSLYPALAADSDQKNNFFVLYPQAIENGNTSFSGIGPNAPVVCQGILQTATVDGVSVSFPENCAAQEIAHLVGLGARNNQKALMWGRPFSDFIGPSGLPIGWQGGCNLRKREWEKLWKIIK
jgi:hypothetical protein